MAMRVVTWRLAVLAAFALVVRAERIVLWNNDATKFNTGSVYVTVTDVNDDEHQDVVALVNQEPRRHPSRDNISSNVAVMINHPNKADGFALPDVMVERVVPRLGRHVQIARNPYLLAAEAFQRTLRVPDLISGQNEWFKHNGDAANPGFEAPVEMGPDWFVPRLIVDFDLDGERDVLGVFNRRLYPTQNRCDLFWSLGPDFIPDDLISLPTKQRAGPGSEFLDGLAVADLDKDGWPDIISPCGYWLQNPHTVSANWTVVPFPKSRHETNPDAVWVVDIVAGDVNRDGNTDIVMIEEFYSDPARHHVTHVVVVMLNKGEKGTLWERQILEYPEHADRYISRLRLADMDHDKDLDILLSGSHFLQMFENNYPYDGFPTRCDIVKLTPISDFFVSDVDNDGSLDIVAVEGANEPEGRNPGYMYDQKAVILLTNAQASPPMFTFGMFISVFVLLVYIGVSVMSDASLDVERAALNAEVVLPDESASASLLSADDRAAAAAETQAAEAASSSPAPEPAPAPASAPSASVLGPQRILVTGQRAIPQGRISSLGAPKWRVVLDMELLAMTAYALLMLALATSSRTANTGLVYLATAVAVLSIIAMIWRWTSFFLKHGLSLRTSDPPRASYYVSSLLVDLPAYVMCVFAIKGLHVKSSGWVFVSIHPGPFQTFAVAFAVVASSVMMMQTIAMYVSPRYVKASPTPIRRAHVRMLFTLLFPVLTIPFLALTGEVWSHHRFCPATS